MHATCYSEITLREHVHIHACRNTKKKKDNWIVFVHGIHGELITLSDINASSRGSTLYSILSARTGIPDTKMCLMRCTKLLKRSATLGASGLENECTIELHIPSCGGGKGMLICTFQVQWHYLLSLLASQKVLIVTPVVQLAYCIVKPVEIFAAIVRVCVFTNQTT